MHRFWYAFPISNGMDRGQKYIIAIAILFIAGMFTFGALSQRSNGSNVAAVIKTIDPDTLPGIQIGNAPWQPEIDNLKGRLDAIALPALFEEGSALHTHQHLDIFINGKSVAVPADIGVNELQSFISPIHTHDYSAVIHVESPTIQTFTLGQFFDIWGVRLSENCIGGYCSDNQKNLKVYVNGKLVAGNPRLLELSEHQEIAVVYGDDAETPNPIPSTYSFGQNL